MAEYTTLKNLPAAMDAFVSDMTIFLVKLGQAWAVLSPSGPRGREAGTVTVAGQSALEIAESFAEAAGQVAAAVGAGLDALAGITTPGFGDITSLPTKIVQILKEAAGKMVGFEGQFYERGRRLGEQVAQGINVLTTKITQTLQEAVNRIATFQGQFYDRGWQLGNALARGLNAGFASSLNLQLPGGFGGGGAYGAQYGMDAVISRPTLIAVAEGGRPEHVEITPLGRESRGGDTNYYITVENAPPDTAWQIDTLMKRIQMGTVAP